jgi:hypothetical protein
VTSASSRSSIASQPGRVLDAVFHAVVHTRGDFVDRLLAHSALEFDEHFGPAETARLGKGYRFSRGFNNASLLFGRDDVRFPLLAQFVELAGEGGNKNEDDSERDMDDEVVAVHGGTSKFRTCLVSAESPKTKVQRPKSDSSSLCIYKGEPGSCRRGIRRFDRRRRGGYASRA